jgi:glutamate racemase
MIGVFDSGVGGLSVLGKIRSLLYVADRARSPYGTKSLSEVREISLDIANWLVERGATTLVVACNTASTTALNAIRDQVPTVPVVGMEPAVKPAASNSRTGVIGVFATAATFQGELFESVVSRYAAGVKVLPVICPEWVELVESRNVVGDVVEQSVEAAVRPTVEAGADTLVLGCTHFSFLKTAVRESAGPGVTVIDPTRAVANQTARIGTPPAGQGSLTLAASGDLTEFQRLVDCLAEFERVGAALPFPS